MAYVYRHIRLDKNVPFYIGVGARTTYERAYEKTNRNIHWKRVVAKTDYEVEILIDNVTPEFARVREMEFVSLYGRKDLGTGTLVNMTEGGDDSSFMKGRKQSPEHIEKRAMKHRGKVLTTETKDKLRLANLGKKQSNETIEKRVSKIRGQKRFFSDEHKRRISETLKGNKLSEETIEKLKIARVGRKPSLGKVNTKEHNKKISEGNCRYLYDILCPDNSIVTVTNLNDFSKKNKLNANFLYTLVGHDTVGNKVSKCKGFRILSKKKNK